MRKLAKITNKEEVIDLLTLCLESTFLQYDANFYQQRHGNGFTSLSCSNRNRNATFGKETLATNANPLPFLVLVL